MTIVLPPMNRERITTMLSDPGLLKSIRATLLLKGVPEREVPDMIQESFTAAFLCDKLPENDTAARQYLFGIVRNKARKLLRDWRDRNHAEFAEELHEGSETPPYEERDLLRKIVAAVPDNRWQSFMWFTRVTFGASLADIAREEGVDYATAHARYVRMTVDLRRWATQIVAGVAVVLVVFGAYRLLRRDPIARGHSPDPAPVVVPPSRPTPSTLLEQQREHDEAVDLRRRAVRDCAAKRWVECQRDLDEAKVREPLGESDATVIELRRQVQGRPFGKDKPPGP